MSKELKVKGRIQNKHGTEADWLAAGTAENPFIPLDGELIIYDPDLIYNYKRFKFGDGETPVHLLEFVKDERLPEVNTLDEDRVVTIVNGVYTVSDIASSSIGAYIDQKIIHPVQELGVLVGGE